jgi:hypothetical protein
MGLKSIAVPRDVKDKTIRDAFVQTRDALNQHAQLLEFFDVHVFVGNGENNTAIGPITISADQTAFSPAGWSGARYVYVAPTATWQIFSFDANVSVKRKTIINVAPVDADIRIRNSSFTDPVAANRVICRKANDIYIQVQDALEIWYDASASRWRPV